VGAPRKYKPGDMHFSWTVIEFRGAGRTYLCKCKCGVIKVVRLGDSSKSCGCERGALLKASYADKLSRGIHHPSRKHGKSQTREYRSYRHMVSRCTNPKNDSYRLYGGRGIKVCQEWLGLSGFDQFTKDMGSRPENTSIDRINPDGNYEPGNCRWANAETQIANRRYIVHISLDRLQKLEAIAKSLGVTV